jgi:4-amino-4-deoxy-L-arabinose transferase-like glycosyltransferase
MTMALRVLVGFQLAVVLAAGIATVDRFPIPAFVDEAAHFAYVKSVADDQRLPLITDRVPSETYSQLRQEAPGGGPLPAGRDLSAFSYEAFQPPLYYALAAPVTAVATGLEAEVRAVRSLNLVLLLLSVGVLFALTRRVCGQDHLLPFSFTLLPLMWPGVIVRAVTVSNAALELLLALCFLHVLWKADAEDDGRALVWAGGLLGLALLTKLTLIYLAFLLAVVAVRMLRRRGIRRGAAAVAAAALLPVLLLGPWAASNQDRYGTLTANTQARDQQAPFLFRADPDFGARDAFEQLPRLLEGFLPQEWDLEQPLPGLDSAADFVPFLLLVPALLFLAGQRRPASREALLLALPVALAAAAIFLTLWIEDWDIFYPRYLYPTLPGLALLAALGLRRVLSDRWVLGYSAGAAALCAGWWVHLAADHYFTGLGRTLGIG